MDANVRLGLSSDAPVVTPDWRVGLVDAVLRRGAPGDPHAQAISVRDAIRAYTINGAWLDHADAWKGSIETGKVADLCVMAANPLDVPVEKIPGIEITHTVVDGDVAYEK